TDVFRNQNSTDQEASAREVLARALMEEGKLAEAREEIEGAGKLTVADLATRLSLAVTGVKQSASAGNQEEVRMSLQASLAEAARLRLAGSQLEIKLALAEIASPAEPALRTLEVEAEKSGYRLIAAKAAHIRQSKLDASRH